jgi:GNAT superfamily N-acetyltransferase/phosphoglycolate phosphatase-like HAD superfamily hydrolase
MPTNFETRQATDADLELLFDILARSLGPHIAEAHGTFDVAEARARFDEVTRPEHHVIVEIDGAPIGCVCAIDRPDELRIARVFLYPEFHGRGIGTQLVRDLIARASERGVRARLRVFKANPARRLYEREGFVVSGETEHHVVMIWSPHAARVRCLLWDFGDTLFDELSLWRGSPDWMAVYDSFDDPDGLGAAWCLGELTTEEIASKLAERFPMSEREIRDHLGRTDVFEPFPFTYGFFRARHLPQAIVTVNPAEFRTLARELGLDEFVSTIVISGEERSTDKGLLCQLALERMDLECANGEALLIDNKAQNLVRWESRGGIGYEYRGDEAFRTDVAQGIDGLVRAKPAAR